MTSRKILLPAVLLMLWIVSCSPRIEIPATAKFESTSTPGLENLPSPTRTAIRVCVEDTARSIEAFRRIEPGMSLGEVCKLVGQPDAVGGSGMWTFVYRLDDGTLVRIGLVDFETIFSVNRFAKNAQGEWEIIEQIVTPP